MDLNARLPRTVLDALRLTMGARTVGVGSWQMTDTCHGSYHFLCMPKIDIKLDGSQNYLGLGHCVHMATSPLVPPALKLSNCESKKKVGLGFLQQNYFIVESE
jgi:hypothetical protein